MSLQSKYSEFVSEFSSGQRMTLSDANTSLYISIINDVVKIIVDKGVIPDTVQNQLKCDFVILDKGRKITRFFELKGEDVKHACDQIHDTVVYFEQNDDLKEIVNNMKQLLGYIVSSHFNVPSIDDTHRKRVCRKLYFKSMDKLPTLFDHLIFIRCITKNPGKATLGNTIFNSNDKPLQI